MTVLPALFLLWAFYKLCKIIIALESWTLCFQRFDNYNSKALLECPVVQKVDSALKSAG